MMEKVVEHFDQFQLCCSGTVNSTWQKLFKGKMINQRSVASSDGRICWICLFKTKGLNVKMMVCSKICFHFFFQVFRAPNFGCEVWSSKKTFAHVFGGQNISASLEDLRMPVIIS